MVLGGKQVDRVLILNATVLIATFGIKGWQWIFILEGLATVIVAILSFWVIQEFPITAKFLTEAERKLMIPPKHVWSMTER